MATSPDLLRGWMHTLDVRMSLMVPIVLHFIGEGEAIFQQALLTSGADCVGVWPRRGHGFFHDSERAMQAPNKHV